MKVQDAAKMLRASATMGKTPGAGVMRGLERRPEAPAGTFKAQEATNTLWAYATMGRGHGAGIMRVLKGRAFPLASSVNVLEQARTERKLCKGSLNG